MDIILYIVIAALCVIIFRLKSQLNVVKESNSALDDKAVKSEESSKNDESELTLTDDEYFKSKRDRIIFLLLEVDGKRRNRLLGISPEMYDDKDAAKKWYKSLCAYVHPDKFPNDYRSKDAFCKLTDLYDLMVEF